MKTRIRRLLTAAAVCASLCASAASRVVSGTVLDKQGRPVVGATVTVAERIAVGTTTDADGRYALQLPDDGRSCTLRASFVGYTTVARSVRADASEP
ncbi:MAG: carboxypeptidase-like regulatory domain-containing protein, partial [Alistipes sp.]|nr:carboxypeptidase-like regulatory domain-containing protein [Alistipes sp.]